MLTSVREPEAPSPDVGPGDELTNLKSDLEVVSKIAVRRPKRAGQRKNEVNPEQALHDMRVPAKVKKLLTGLLQKLSYALDETDVPGRYGRSRRVSVVRSGDDTRYLLYIPSAVLKDEDNIPEFDHLKYSFIQVPTIYIVSPKRNSFPNPYFTLIVKEQWSIRVSFIDWKLLKVLNKPKFNPSLKAVAELFEPPLASRPDRGPSSAEHPVEGDHEHVAVLPREHAATGFAPRGGGGGVPSAKTPGLNLTKPDKDWIVSELARLTPEGPPDPKHHYEYLIPRAGLPEDWIQQLSGTWTGNARVDAHSLVDFALSKGVNPSDTKYTALGSLLTTLFEYQDLDQQYKTAALIYAYKLYGDEGLLTDLAARYQLPVPTPEHEVADQTHPSPQFDLREQLDEGELQGLLSREPEFFDVGFLSRRRRRGLQAYAGWRRLMISRSARGSW